MAHNKWRKGGNNVSMHDTHYVCRVQVISMIIDTKITQKKLHFTGINNVLFSFVSPTTHHIQVTCAWSLFVRRWRGHTFSDLIYLFLTLNFYQVFGLQNSTAPTFIPAISLICHSQMKGSNGIAHYTHNILPKARDCQGRWRLESWVTTINVLQICLMLSTTSDFLYSTKEFLYS